MWANKEGEYEIGKGLLHFVGWMLIQSFVIIVLESLHLLPGEYINEGMDYSHFRDYFTLYCGLVGAIYTAIGCIIITQHEVNSLGWWRRCIGWYLAYLPLSFLAFYDDLWWGVVDVWLAPVLWVGEIELVYHIQKKIYTRNELKAFD